MLSKREMAYCELRHPSLAVDAGRTDKRRKMLGLNQEVKLKELLPRIVLKETQSECVSYLVNNKVKFNDSLLQEKQYSNCSGIHVVVVVQQHC